MVLIFFQDELLDEMAEILELQVRLIDTGQTAPFKDHAEDLFEQFQARHNQYLMLKIFE